MVRFKKILSIFSISRFRYKKFGFPSYILKPFYLIGSSKLSLGNKVRILQNFRCEIFDQGSVTINDDVSIGHNCHLSSCDQLVIDSGTVISSNVFIGALDHDLTPNHSIPIMLRNNICRSTYIGKNVFIGTGAVILAGSVLEDNCVIGANAVIRDHVPNGFVVKTVQNLCKH